MEFVLTVIGATPRSHSAIPPTIFKSPNDAMDYAIALRSVATVQSLSHDLSSKAAMTVK